MGRHRQATRSGHDRSRKTSRIRRRKTASPVGHYHRQYLHPQCLPCRADPLRPQAARLVELGKRRQVRSGARNVSGSEALPPNVTHFAVDSRPSRGCSPLRVSHSVESLPRFSAESSCSPASRNYRIPISACLQTAAAVLSSPQSRRLPLARGFPPISPSKSLFPDLPHKSESHLGCASTESTPSCSRNADERWSNIPAPAGR